LYCKAVCAALDKVFIHDVSPDSVHQFTLAVGFDGWGWRFVRDVLIPASKISTEL
jgi:hypothetical protein